MKKNIFFLLLLSRLCCQGQLTVNILVPPSGMMDKQQLWNILVTNTESLPFNVQVNASFSELSTGLPVFTASTGIFSISGTKQLSAANIGPIRYTLLNSDYRMDPSATGLLPVGRFMVCYEFMIQKYNKVVQECRQLVIPPLGPLLLTVPANTAVLPEAHPSFGWIPPSPTTSLGNLRYQLKVAEVLPGQTANDAMQENIPLFSATHLLPTNYLYSQSAPALQPGRQYAWQIVAMNNLTEITKSEAWSFTIKGQDPLRNLPAPDPSYIKLKKAGTETGYAVCWGDLRFDYLNETKDSVWNIQVQDLSSASHPSFTLATDTLKLRRGQNLLSYPASGDKRFIDHHQYLFRVVNSRNETWQLRFEYRKQDN